jgi:hypothetical protein
MAAKGCYPIFLDRKERPKESFMALENREKSEVQLNNSPIQKNPF